MSLLKLRRRPEPAVALPEPDRLLTWRLAALLLDYPSRETLDLLDTASSAVERLPAPIGPALAEFIGYLRNTDEIALAATYVETFDLRKRASLHLTFYAYGDTRKRGMALLRFKHAYQHAGVELDDRELPDHLPVLLEFAATVDPIGGERLLGEHLPVIELLRLSLADTASPYAAVLGAVTATLPPLTTADRRRIAELAAQGPPDEDVGLEPFAMDPSLFTSGEGRR